MTDAAQTRLETDVAIVGAGLAGLALAAGLRRRGREVLVLEARDRVGGRMVNADLGDGAICEMGGQYLNAKQRRTYALAGELGLDTFTTYAEGDSLVEVDGRVERQESFEPLLGASAQAELQRIGVELDRLASEVPCAEPWRHPRADELDSLTLADWLERQRLGEHTRQMIETISHAYWAIGSHQVSLLHVLFGIATGGGYFTVATAEEDSHRVVGGTARFAERLAEELGECVLLGRPVTAVATDSGQVAARGLKVAASRVVMTMPPHLAGRLEYDPPLPAQRDQFTQRAPFGAIIKFATVYDAPFWREGGLSGHVTTLDRPLAHVYDNSPPDGYPGVLVCFSGGPDAWRQAALPPDERRAAALATLGDFFGEAARHPKGIHEVIWADERYTRGAYSSNLGPGTWTSVGEAWRRPVGRLHFAGAETAASWYGHMEGALDSAERVLEELDGAAGPG